MKYLPIFYAVLSLLKEKINTEKYMLLTLGKASQTSWVLYCQLFRFVMYDLCKT